MIETVSPPADPPVTPTKARSSVSASSSGATQGTSTRSAQSLSVLAYIPYWDQARAIASLKKNADVITEASLFWYVLGADGSIGKYADAQEDRAFLSWAKDRGIRVLALIANLAEEGVGENWDPTRVDRVIADPVARNKHIENLLDLVEQGGFDGLDIDYENLREDQKGHFTAFIEELAAALHARGKRLRVSVFTQNESGETRGQDLPALGKVVDELGFMTYNEHWSTSRPGPIASLPWVKESLMSAFRHGVSQNVAFMGIPLYGYDWPPAGGGRGLEFEEISALLTKQGATLHFDERAASPSFTYGGHTVWFENGQSVGEKIALAQELGVGGVAFWRLGGEDSAIWDALRSRVRE